MSVVVAKGVLGVIGCLLIVLLEAVATAERIEWRPLQAASWEYSPRVVQVNGGNSIRMVVASGSKIDDATLALWSWPSHCD